MPRNNTILGQLARLGRLGCAVVALTCLGLSGCMAFRVPDLDAPSADDFFTPAGEFPPVRDRQTTPFAVTNKGMQISSNLD